jgi:3-methyladenine DNA glycosylase AlkD
MGQYAQIKRELGKLKDSKKAAILARFFKTGKGEYAEGDRFLGVVVPKQREIAKKYPHATLSDVQKLLGSKIHEQRLTALFILINQYKKGSDTKKEQIVNFYLSNITNINNWDLVDLSAGNILGDFLQDKDKTVLYQFAKSEFLWERRISIIATISFIKKGMFEDTCKIAEILLFDQHDLVQKAVGWMLREIGKKNQKTEEDFLVKHFRKMPRTALRYAIEKFSSQKRNYYLDRTKK